MTDPRTARYDHAEIEQKWQRYWLDHETFRAEDLSDKPKFYALGMFPYPSGDGLHVGHPEGYTATDIMARYKRMRGFNVLQPMGWDAFGLPAEQHALKTGRHPRDTTAQNIATFKGQLQRLGFAYDWSREINTTDPGYFRWTQWIFLKLYERGLAYEAEVPVNWCPELGTVLANEEVIDGKSERGGHPVVRRPMRQWMLRITDYAERLLAGLDALDWTDSIKAMQRNWIGRSEGAEVHFPLQGGEGRVTVFTTRPDTLFGATYMVLAPEHPLVSEITTAEQKAEVEAYAAAAASKSDLARAELQLEKTGVFTGAYAINPVNDQAIPVWIADYVLAGYGTGAIMSVPAHDERDWAFARKFDLPIVPVVATPGGAIPDVSQAAYTDDGVAVNSGDFDGLETAAFKRAVCAWLEERGAGKAAVSYRLRDWLFSRQRYWGEPMPLVHLEDGTVRPLPADALPLGLPEVESYKPTGTGDSPLASAEAWLRTTDPESGAPARRETNTMPQWAGSCWYYLRYIDPTNDQALCDPEKERYWMPVDLYIGGAEHAVLHLLYARFWHMVLFDAGVVSTPEPFQKLVNQGMILGELEYTRFSDASGAPVSAAHVGRDGDQRIDIRTGAPVTPARVEADKVEKQGDRLVWSEAPDVDVEARAYKMSKSRGNVINPDDIVAVYGADALRLYEMFMGPLEAVKPWSTKDIPGVARFLDRVYRLSLRATADGPGEEAIQRATHRAIQKVTTDIEALRFNTAISALMVFTNELGRVDPVPEGALAVLAQLLSPFAPHLAEEMWERLGRAAPVAHATWPTSDPALLEEDTVEIAVQVNGKLRARERVPRALSREETEARIMQNERVQALLEGKTVRKVIVVPGRLCNVVAR